MVEFGEQLRRAREEKGMTQQSLAEQLYVTRQAVSRWECGAYYSDIRSALTDAITNVVQNGADVETEIQNAQDTVEFNISE